MRIMMTMLVTVLLSTVSLGATWYYEDNFDSPHNYLVDGVAGTMWDGFFYNGGWDAAQNATVQAAAAVDGHFHIASTNAGWSAAVDDGACLYKTIAGDFVAEMYVLKPWSTGSFNAVRLAARVANNADAGAGEDWIAVGVFCNQNFNQIRSVDNGVLTQVNMTIPALQYLRMERTGNAFRLYRKAAAGDAWEQVYEKTRDDMDGLPLQVGLFHDTWNGGSFYVDVDYIRIEPASASIYRAQNPVPADPSSRLVPQDVVLQWDKGKDPNTPALPNPDITQHYVYLTTEASNGEPNFVNVSPITVSDTPDPVEYDPALDSSDLNKIFYWRVDESVLGSGPDDPNTIEGPVWQFDTLTLAEIVVQPADADAFPGETASVAISVSSQWSTPEYQWYKSQDNANNTLADDTAVGTNSATYLIDSVTTSDEGYYYCVVSNLGGDVMSDTAHLIVKRQILYWPLEGDFTDASGEGHDGVGSPAPSFEPNVPGAVGSYSAYFDGTDQAVTAALDPALDMEIGYTLALWVRPFSTPQYASAFNSGSGFQIDFDGGGNYRFNSLAGGAYLGDAPAEWNYLVIVSDGTETTVRNLSGQVIQTIAGANTVFDRFELGQNRSGLSPYFNGLIDDVKIWNYPLSDEDIAAEYYAVTGKGSCLYPPEFDLSGDCYVNLLDLAMLAQTWLECGMVPKGACN